MIVKTLICYRKGNDPFRYDDMNSRAFGIEPEFDAYFAAVYPPARAGGHNEVIDDVLQAVEQDSDTYVVVRTWTRDERRPGHVQSPARRNTEDLASLGGTTLHKDSLLRRIGERLVEMSDSDKTHH
jgi:hypothetical protein